MLKEKYEAEVLPDELTTKHKTGEAKARIETGREHPFLPRESLDQAVRLVCMLDKMKIDKKETLTV